MSTGHEIRVAENAPPEILALAEVLQVAAPGLRLPHTVLAGTIVRMLASRGVCLVPASRGGQDAPEYVRGWNDAVALSAGLCGLLPKLADQIRNLYRGT